MRPLHVRDSLILSKKHECANDLSEYIRYARMLVNARMTFRDSTILRATRYSYANMAHEVRIANKYRQKSAVLFIGMRGDDLTPESCSCTSWCLA